MCQLLNEYKKKTIHFYFGIREHTNMIQYLPILTFSTHWLYLQGCYEKMIGWFRGNSTYILAASGAIVAIEVTNL